MFEMLVGAATILSGVAAVVMAVLAVIDRLKRPSAKKQETD